MIQIVLEIAAICSIVLLPTARACLGGDARKPLPTEMGQWWESRGDRHLSARSTLKGTIVSPAILWKHRVAARQALLAAAVGNGPDNSRTQQDLPGSDIVHSEVSPERLLSDWGAAIPWADLDGAGKLQPLGEFVTYNSKLGRILPSTPGIQMVSGEALSYPDRDLGTVRLNVRQGGHWVQKWATVVDSLIWQCEPIFGDFDHDGRVEIALLPWYKLNLLDAETGTVKQAAEFKLKTESPETGGRAYGWFGAVNLDRRGPDEFVIIDDFTQHIAVMGWRDGKLTRLWNRIFRRPGSDMPTADETVSLIINPQPVQDVDGDGRAEIVLSLFNASHDLRWHVLVIDGIAGEIRHDLAGWFLAGLRDVDGDGAVDLFCAQTKTGVHRPDPSTLRIISFNGNRQQTLWELAGASFQTGDLPDFPDNVNSGSPLPRRTIVCGPLEPNGKPVFFTRHVKDVTSQDVELTAWRHNAASAQIESIGHMNGPRLEALAVRPAAKTEPALLLRASTFDGEGGSAVVENGTLRPLASQAIAPPAAPAVIGRMAPGQPPVVILQGANETIEAIHPQHDGDVQRLWRVPGRTMTSNNFFEGALLADLAGDGSLAAVVAGRGAGGCARIRVLDALGREVWHRDFEEFPGDPPPWNVSGLIYWQAGYFRDPNRMDLLVQLRRKGAETQMLDGRSGAPIWFRARATPERDFGHNLFTLFDYNGDGRDDVLTHQPDVFCIADGATGELLLQKHARDLLQGDPYYGSSVAYDFVGDGTTQILYCSVKVIAMLRLDGTIVWRTPWDPKDPRHPNYGSDVRIAPGDADGDGKLDLFVSGVRVGGKRELQCLDATTGTLKWRVPLPEQKPTEPAVADVDGDGRDECVFTIASTLYCIGGGAVAPGAGGRSGGAVEWTLPLPDYTNSVCIADPVGDGTAQVIVPCDNGYVYGIGAHP